MDSRFRGNDKSDLISASLKRRCSLIPGIDLSAAQINQLTGQNITVQANRDNSRTTFVTRCAAAC
jgi:hypothetical protein